MALSSKLSKQHACQEPGCVKSFKRLDHLHRHALNHSSVGSTCSRCRAHFKRPDLLERHMLRHRKKDEEAGGEGLGVVETRKRLWCDVNGKIVQSRPKSPERRKIQRSRTFSPVDSPPSLCQSQISTEPQAQTPPYEDDDSERSYHDSEFGFSARHCNSSPFLGLLPITTPVTSFAQTIEPIRSHEMCFSDSGDTLAPDDISQWMQINDFTAYSSSRALDHSTVDGALPANKHSSFGSLHGDECTSHPRRPSRKNSYFNSDEPSCSNYEQNTTSMYVPEGRQTFNSAIKTFQRADTSYMKAINNGSQPMDYTYLSSRHSRPSKCLPDASLSARQTSIHQPFVILPDSGSPTISESENVLPLKTVQSYLQMYFEHFNRQFQLIHQGSFEPSTAHPLLLASMVLMGATYGDIDAIELASSLQTSVKSQILRDYSTHTKPDLWLIQTLILIVSYDLHRAGQQEQIATHLFHSFLLSLSLVHTSSFEETDFVDASVNIQSLHSQWRAAMLLEERKRATLMCLVIDTQRAAIKSRSPDMCSTELHVELPCDATVWESSSAEQWHHLTQSRNDQPQLYSTILKSYLSREMFSRAPNLNMTTYILVLYGLLSLSLSFKRQAHGVLEGDDSERRAWHNKLSSALDIWKADYDSATMRSPTQRSFFSNAGHNVPDFHLFETGALTIYHISHLVLNANISDLQMCVGPSQAGRRNSVEFVQRQSYQRIVGWITTKSAMRANKAIWHAAHIIRGFEFKEHHYSSGYDIYYPWCLYIAALTLQMVSDVRKRHSTPDINADASHKDSPANSVQSTTADAGIERYEMGQEVRNVTSTIISRGCADYPGMTGEFPTQGIMTLVADFLADHKSRFAKELGMGLNCPVMFFPMA